MIHLLACKVDNLKKNYLHYLLVHAYQCVLSKKCFLHRVDNVGILKLRNADVEQRIGLAKAKKKSTRARLIFRVMFQKVDGNMQTLQISSNSILCSKFQCCTMPKEKPHIRFKCMARCFYINSSYLVGFCLNKTCT